MYLDNIVIIYNQTKKKKKSFYSLLLMSADVSYEFSIDVMFKIMNPRLNYIVIYFPNVASVQFVVDVRLYNDFASMTTIVLDTLLYYAYSYWFEQAV